MSKKLLVYNSLALTQKYGSNSWSKISNAILSLQQYDQTQGIADRLFDLSGTEANPKITSNYSGARGDTKNNIDNIWKAGSFVDGDYMTIVGSPDTVAHQLFSNPACIRNVNDRRMPTQIPSDLPYACSTPYSTENSQDIRKFASASRSVGRIPDVRASSFNGNSDPQPLLSALTAARTKSTYLPGICPENFSLSGATFRGATFKNLGKACSTMVGTPYFSPPVGTDSSGKMATPSWSRDQLAKPMHLFVLHGQQQASYWLGDDGGGVAPIAYEGSDINGKLPAGVVVAANNCWGASLYAPSEPSKQSICNVYMASGASAFLGSTTTAVMIPPPGPYLYAPKMTGLFMKYLLAGQSAGIALLKARKVYADIGNAGGLNNNHDLLTYAEFILLGDSSFVPFPGCKAHNQVFTNTRTGEL